MLPKVHSELDKTLRARKVAFPAIPEQKRKIQKKNKQTQKHLTGIPGPWVKITLPGSDGPQVIGCHPSTPKLLRKYVLTKIAL